MLGRRGYCWGGEASVGEERLVLGRRGWWWDMSRVELRYIHIPVSHPSPHLQTSEEGTFLGGARRKRGEDPIRVI